MDVLNHILHLCSGNWPTEVKGLHDDAKWMPSPSLDRDQSPKAQMESRVHRIDKVALVHLTATCFKTTTDE